MRIKQRLPHQRPREKLLQLGPDALSLEELWMCVLGMGRPGMRVEQLARRVARVTHANFGKNITSSLQDLGSATQARVLAVIALLERFQARQNVVVRSPQDVLLFCTELRQAKREKVLVLYCGTDGGILHQEIIAIGGINSALLSPRDVFLPIRWLPVSSLVLCHNHPSGNLEPSDADIIFTKRVQAACELMGLKLHDHLIVTKQSYTSFQEQGWLTPASEGNQDQLAECHVQALQPIEYSFPLG